MIKRNGFVSNSSSSSFIVAGNDDPIIQVRLVDIPNIIYKVIKTREELVAFFEEEKYRFVETEMLEIYNQCERLITDNSKIIYAGSVSSDDGGISEMLYRNGTLSNMLSNFEIVEDIKT